MIENTRKADEIDAFASLVNKKIDNTKKSEIFVGEYISFIKKCLPFKDAKSNVICVQIHVGDEIIFASLKCRKEEVYFYSIYEVKEQYKKILKKEFDLDEFLNFKVSYIDSSHINNAVSLHVVIN